MQAVESEPKVFTTAFQYTRNIEYPRKYQIFFFNSKIYCISFSSITVQFCTDPIYDLQYLRAHSV